MQTTIACAICGKQFSEITWKHLKHHNMSLLEYKNKYPNNETMSEATKAKKALNKKNALF